MGAASSRDENTVDISNLSTCLYISCIVTLIGFLYYSNRESRRKYLRLARSKLHGCKDKLAERRGEHGMRAITRRRNAHKHDY